MAGSRKPGSLGTLPEVHDLNDGTMIRGLTSVPGSIGADASIRKHSKSSADIVPKHSGLRKPSPVSPETLKKGSRGSRVQKLQRQLNTSLSPSPKLATDGIFGPRTHQAVVQYQRALSLPADGIVGKKTWYFLLRGDTATDLQPTRVTQTSAGGATAVPQSAAVVPAAGSAPAAKAGIWEWTLEEKFASVLRRTVPRLPGSMQREFEALLSPTSLAIITGTLAVWAASHAFGIGEAVDVALLLAGAFFLGMAAFDVASELGDFLVVTFNAESEQQLDEAASHLARAVALIGVTAFVVLLTKIARTGRGRGAPPEGPPEAKTTEPPPRTVPRESVAEPPATKEPAAGKTVAPVENTTYGGIKPARVRPGANDKVAVIGRSMDDAVQPYTKGLQEAGYNVETFGGDKISPGAQAEWNMLRKKYAPNPIPEDVVRNSQMFEENQAWASKLGEQGYTVVDVGNPGGRSPSPFYEMEKQILFGDAAAAGAR